MRGRQGNALRALGAALSMATCAPSLAAASVTKVQCVEANTKGQDLRRDGKLSASREQFAACADPECPEIVRDDCTKRLDEVERAQPTVVFAAKDEAGEDLTAVKISVDGKPIADSIIGAALAVDPGAHAFTFEVAGRPPVTEHLVLHEGEKERTERVTIPGGASAPTGGPSAAAATATETAPAVRPAPGHEGDGRAQRTVGLAVGGVGVASLLAGAVFGSLTFAAHSDYMRHCGGNIGAPEGQCDAQGVAGQKDAATKGTLSTIFFLAGGVAVAAGATLFFTAPHGRPGVQVGLGPVGVVLRAAW